MNYNPPGINTTMAFEPATFFVRNCPSHRRANSNLVILNQPISNFCRFCVLWDNTVYRICADGGANRLHDLLSQNGKLEDQSHMPDSIHGDLDSIQDDVRQFFVSKGVRLGYDGDQYSTDFQKAMKILTRGYSDSSLTHLNALSPPQSQTEEVKDIVVMSTLSGRVDQALGLLHELYRETKTHANGSSTPIKLWLVSEQAISFILPIGKCVIRGIGVASGVFKKHAGILPIYGEARITTHGFEWDVHNWPTRMGEMVSTSNHVIGDEVSVEVAGEMVLFTLELA